MESYLGKGAEIILPKGGLDEKLIQAKKGGRPLIIKLGFDPTAPDLHLGHAVVLKKLKEFQEAGHRIVVILGDFTAHIGDPTGKNKARPPLSKEKIEQNAQTYLAQLSKILDVTQIEVRYNSEWFDQMSLRDTIQLISSTTLAQILERNDFKQRYQGGIPVSMHELVYPILQGYDSVVIDSDVEIGGTDQLFNIQIGRYMQEVRQKVAQVALCMPLLKGIDGSDKMSKSQGNYIGLTEEPNTMYGKVMSIPDSLLLEYLDLTTNLPKEERQSLIHELEGGRNPMEIKKIIARNIVHQYHGEVAALAAEEFFYRQIQLRSVEVKDYSQFSAQSLGFLPSSVPLIDLIAAIEPERSRSQIRTLVKSGAVQINGGKIVDEHHHFSVSEEILLKVGKRGYYKLVP
ncbi:MAG: tyrosine--tRNA ligase [Candidatus Peribacter sp.]|nr:tyrosine--tRNA ligase [Candidatus Peribacter sp.]